MIRVGLTGELGSGKSTVARLLAERGATVLSSDEMARAMMQPGQAVYQAIVGRFGASVVLADGQLDRPALARLAFGRVRPRVEELNSIVHPPVLAEQERLIGEIACLDPRAVIVIESALIFAAQFGDGQPWRTRFDRVVLVTAPDAMKVERFVKRTAGFEWLDAAQRKALRRDAEARLRTQRLHPPPSDGVTILPNDGDLRALETRVGALFADLLAAAQ